jgi:hypothetical protein
MKESLKVQKSSESHLVIENLNSNKKVRELVVETQFALVLVATSTDWKARADNDVTILEISTDEQALQNKLLPLTAKLLEELRKQELEDVTPEEAVAFESIYFQLHSRDPLDRSKKVLAPTICCRYGDGGSGSWGYKVEKVGYPEKDAQ